MQSIATHHFPQVVIEGTGKWLFNPVLKKRFANRPEERVRLRWIEYLLHQTDWKRSRIGFETPVQLRQEKNKVRTDLILYSDQMKPYILIECKSEKVSLTPKVAEQAARYNATIGAEHIVLTNGVDDYWFSQNKQDAVEQPGFLKETEGISHLRQNPEYWIKRGFCSGSSNKQVQKWVQKVLLLFFDEEITWETRYLPFGESLVELPMDHYYRVADIDKETKVALGFIGARHSSSCIVGVLNKKGINAGVVIIDIDLLMNGMAEPIEIFKTGENDKVNMTDIQKSEFLNIAGSDVEKLPFFIMRFFD